MDVCAGLCLEEPHCLVDLPLGSASSLLGLLSNISFQGTNSQLKEREQLRFSGKCMSLTFWAGVQYCWGWSLSDEPLGCLV